MAAPSDELVSWMLSMDRYVQGVRASCRADSRNRFVDSDLMAWLGTAGYVGPIGQPPWPDLFSLLVPFIWPAPSMQDHTHTHTLYYQVYVAACPGQDPAPNKHFGPPRSGPSLK